MIGHKDFIEDMFKTEKDALSEGVIEKDTKARFGIGFVGRIETQPWKT